MEHDILNNDIKWMTKYFEEKFNQRDINLTLQAREYERRLDELNHEKARIIQAQEKSVSVDKFEGAISQIYSRIDDIRKDMAALSEFKQSTVGQGQARKDIMDLVKLLIVIAGFFIAYFVIKK